MNDTLSPLHNIKPAEATEIYVDWGKVSTGIWKQAFDAYIRYYKQLVYNKFKTAPDDELPALRTTLVTYDKVMGIQERILDDIEAVRKNKKE